jgi:non-heme Fe2+,alpha-ketoglutarate-dependent halogenase
MQYSDSRLIRDSYKDKGYCFPVDVMTAQQASDYRVQIEAVEGEIENRDLGRKGQLNHMHIALTFANEIVRNENILDAVEAVIGPDIMV